jgi:transcriptional regulator with XRE-family HTH domain
LPERIKAYRKIRGLSRKKLARILGVDEGTLWRWETGQCRPQGGYARRVRELLAGSGRYVIVAPEVEAIRYLDIKQRWWSIAF